MLNSGKEWEWMDEKVNESEYNKIVKSIDDAETHEEVFTALQWISSYEKLNGKTSADQLRKIAVEQIKSI
tara:strand:+ start:172 stop:381 length:210 start_codon:yes stop_codon:yes gene_type:complete